MICPKCNFLNPDGSARCGKCGFTFAAMNNPTNMVNMPDNTYEEVSGDTTDVLTSSMTPKMEKPGNMPQRPATQPVQTPPTYASKSSALKGDKKFFAVSIVVAAVLLGILVFSSVHYKNEIKDLKKDKKEISASAETDSKKYQDEIASLTDANNKYASQIAALEGNLSNLGEELDTVKDEAGQVQDTNKEYEKYNELISFADSYKALQSDIFFCSDSVLHLNVSDKKVKVLVYFLPKMGDLECEASVEGVVSTKWAKEEKRLDDGKVYPLYVTPQGAGNTVLTIKNQITNDELKIYVSVTE